MSRSHPERPNPIGSLLAALGCLYVMLAAPAWAAPDAGGASPSWYAEHFDLLLRTWVVLLVVLVILMVWEVIFWWQRKQERAIGEGSPTIVGTAWADNSGDDPFKTLLKDKSPLQAPASAPSAPREMPTTLPPEIAARVSSAGPPPVDFDRTAAERSRIDEAEARPARPVAPPADAGPRKVRLGEEADSADVGLKPYQPPTSVAPPPPPMQRAPGAGAGRAAANDTWSDLLKKAKAPDAAAAAPAPTPAEPPEPAVPPVKRGVPLGKGGVGPGADPWQRLLKASQENVAAETPAKAAAEPPPAAPAERAAPLTPLAVPATPTPPAPPVASPEPASRPPVPVAAAVTVATAVGTRVPLPGGVLRTAWAAACARLEAAVLRPVGMSLTPAAESDSSIAPLTRTPAPAEMKRGRKMKLAGGRPEPVVDYYGSGEPEQAAANNRMSATPTPVPSTPMPSAIAPPVAPPPLAAPGVVPPGARRVPPPVAARPTPPTPPPVSAPPPPMAPAAAAPPPPVVPAAAAPRPPAPPVPVPPPAVPPRKASIKLEGVPGQKTAAPQSAVDNPNVPDFVKSADRMLTLPLGRDRDLAGKSTSDAVLNAAAPPSPPASEKEIPSLLKNAEGDRRFLEISRSLREVRVEKEGLPGETAPGE